MRALDIDVVKDSDKWQSTMRSRETRLGIVEHFVFFSLIFLVDKLPTFSGLDYEIWRDSDSYVAGLQEKDIPQVLLWTAESSMFNTDVYRASTWSQAVIEGHMSYEA